MTGVSKIELWLSQGSDSFFGFLSSTNFTTGGERLLGYSFIFESSTYGSFFDFFTSVTFKTGGGRLLGYSLAWESSA